MADDSKPKTWREKLAEKKGLSFFFNTASNGTDLDAAIGSMREQLGTIGFLSRNPDIPQKKDAEKAQEFYQKAQKSLEKGQIGIAADMALYAFKYGYDRDVTTAFIKDRIVQMIDWFDPNQDQNDLERFFETLSESNFSQFPPTDFLSDEDIRKISKKFSEVKIVDNHHELFENNRIIKNIRTHFPKAFTQYQSGFERYYDQIVEKARRDIQAYDAKSPETIAMRALHVFAELTRLEDFYEFDLSDFINETLSSLQSNGRSSSAASILNDSATRQFMNYEIGVKLKPEIIKNILLDIAGGKHNEAFGSMMLEYGGLFDEEQRQKIEGHHAKRLIKDARTAMKDGHVHKALSFVSEASLADGSEDECRQFISDAFDHAKRNGDYKALLDMIQNGAFHSLSDGADNTKLDYEDYKEMLSFFTKQEDALSLIRVRVVLHENNPEYLEKLEDDGFDFRISPQQFLHIFAPTITQDNDKAPGLAYLFKHMDHDILAQAQCADLEYIWDALEAADPEKKDIPEYNMDALAEGVLDAGQEKMIPEGREDINFTKEDLQKLYMDVARYMGIVQLQRPVFFSDTLDVEKRMQTIFRDDQDTFEDMVAKTRYVSGSRTNLLNGDHGEITASSRFGFFTIKKKERVELKDGHYDRESLIAMPVITIEDEILKATIAHDSEEILHHFQEMMGIFNHDYFHHFTGRIINPYIAGGSGINLDKTPYAVMLGKEKMLGPTKAHEPSEIDRILYGSNALGAELSYRFQNEHYGMDPRWKAFNEGNDYEFHALHLHADLYKNWLDDEETGQKMRGHIRGYFQAINDLSQKLSENGDAEMASRAALYYSKLLYFNLLRIVPHDHVLGQLVEEEFEYLGIDKDFMLSHTENAVKDMGSKAQEHILKNAISVVPKDDEGEEISLHRHIGEGRLDTAHMLRIQAYVCAYRDLDILHKPEFQYAQDYALSAMQRYTSAVQRDMTTIDRRGGLEAFESVMAAQMRTKERARNETNVMEKKF